MLPFFQDPPRLTNTFAADPALSDTLERLLPAALFGSLRPSWQSMGEAACGRYAALALEAETHPPRHVPFDPWGRRIDQLEISPAWRELAREAARWGLVGIPYEPALGPHGRIHQFALIALFAPSSAIATCPLAMTDGAARTLLTWGDPALAARAVPRLTAREQAWSAGQWMTERTGGSDVSGTSTVARRAADGTWTLWGDKWFTSAVDCDVALMLARAEGAPEGSAGLSLFYMELHREDGSWNGLRLHRLKDKLGTRALPTGELTLEGAAALPVGELGRGVKKIATVLNLTRLHNAVNACGLMARQLQLLRDYSRRRVAFGGTLAERPLHRETVAGLQVEYEAALALTFECARLLGLVESSQASAEEQAALRLFTPLAKLATGKQAVASASEAVEGFGGAGYCEDTGVPVWLRDAQVLSIWEGTTNVLSLDALRAAVHEGALEPALVLLERRLERLAGGPVARLADKTRTRLGEYRLALGRILASGEAQVEGAGRRLALGLAGLISAVALGEQAAWAAARDRGPRTALVLERWLSERLLPPPDPARSDERLAGSGVLSALLD